MSKVKLFTNRLFIIPECYPTQTLLTLCCIELSTPFINRKEILKRFCSFVNVTEIRNLFYEESVVLRYVDSGIQKEDLRRVSLIIKSMVGTSFRPPTCPTGSFR